MGRCGSGKTYLYLGLSIKLLLYHYDATILVCERVIVIAARNHVNRMCLAADVPLVESGTAGYLGQVTVIKKVSISGSGYRH